MNHGQKDRVIQLPGLSTHGECPELEVRNIIQPWNDSICMCHPGAGRGPELNDIIENIWISAFAGMTVWAHRSYAANF
jgi:hypothetical protein